MPGSSDLCGNMISPTESGAEPYNGNTIGIAMERRLSTSSDASCSESSNALAKGDSTMEYIPTRMTKVTTPKPAANPLQFIKVGPCDLFKSAQETLKKVEEVKKMKREVRDDAEDWQSNLDNWKCSRRKRVEHIIDRVVDIKKLELEEHERNRRKNKTFNEMMEERHSRGRKMSLLVHKDDDSNDFSDLGIGTSSDKSSVSEDFGNEDNHNGEDCDDQIKSNYIDQNGNSKKMEKGCNNIFNGAHYDDTSTSATVSSPEPEEYTYDGAIQGYVNFTETRVKSRNNTQICRTDVEKSEEASGFVRKGQNGTTSKNSQSSPSKPRRSSIKIEEEILELERKQFRKGSGSQNDTSSPEKKISVPKVDISKRKELFEKSKELGDQNDTSKVAPRAAADLTNAKSIRDRVSNLERQKSEENVEKAKQPKRLSGEISVKDRLVFLEKQQSTENVNISRNKPSERKSTGDTSNSSLTVRDRLSSLEKSTVQSDKDKTSRVLAEVPSSTSVRSRVTELSLAEESCSRTGASFASQDKLTSTAELSETEAESNILNNNPNEITESEVYVKRHFHRSLDSLDVDSSSQISNDAFERVQSLEDLDNCNPSRNYPSSALSNENLIFSSQCGDTDREDSGIHTADVSCSVSQADDPADVGDINIPVGSTTSIENDNTFVFETEDMPRSAFINHHLKEPAFENDKSEPAANPKPLNAPVVVSHSQNLFDRLARKEMHLQPFASKCFESATLSVSCLSPIPEVYHDNLPTVVVMDTNSVSTNQNNSSQLPMSPVETLLDASADDTGRLNCTSNETVMDFTAISGEVLLASHFSNSLQCMQEQSSVEWPNNVDESLFSEQNKKMQNINLCCNAKGEGYTASQLFAEEFSSTDENCALNLEVLQLCEGITTEETSTNFLVQDFPAVIEAIPDKGPKPFSSKAHPKNFSSSRYGERDAASITCADADTDVSSFLEQAFLAEDLKADCFEPVNEVGTSSKLVSESSHQIETITSDMVCTVGNNQIASLNFSSGMTIISDGIPLTFSLDPSPNAMPPKEKPPPPPPTELSDEEASPQSPAAKSNSSSGGSRRFDSTKRLKKEIRRKRSDFLGIGGLNDESYLEPELKVAPPPDMTSFLQEERRLEHALYRQNQSAHHSELEHGSNHDEQLYRDRDTHPEYSESDQGSNQGESRDSGVELDSHLLSHLSQTGDSWGNKQIALSPDQQSSEAHSRQNSEPFGNASTASEEDEVVKKEREIIDILEKEEQWRYGTSTVLSSADHHQVGEKLAAKLRELEQEKMMLEWERAEEAKRAAAEHAARQEEQRRIRLKEQQLKQQESIVSRLPVEVATDSDPDMTSEALREERERLRREQAELERQKELLSEHRQTWDSHDPRAISSPAAAHRSLQDVSGSQLAVCASQNGAQLNYRLSLPDLKQDSLNLAGPRTGSYHRGPPPPIPPAKPLSALSHERRVKPRNSQIQAFELDPVHQRQNSVGVPTVPTSVSPASSTGSQQMSRQTLHALSAAPRSKIIATDTWVQAKRKPESQRNSNRDHYQHWLIQEAEHRRITEQHQRNAAASRRPAVSQPTPEAQLKTNSPPTATVQTSHTSQYHQYSATQQAVQHQYLPHHQHSHQHHSHLVSQSGTAPQPPPRQEKPLPDAIIQTLTQRVQNRVSLTENPRRVDGSPVRENRCTNSTSASNNANIVNSSFNHSNGNYAANSQEKMLSVSGKKKCSHCNEELGRGAAMIIESLRLFYHMDCFKCCVCHVQLGDGLMGTDVRVRNQKLHCHNCYSSDDGVKFSCV